MELKIKQHTEIETIIDIELPYYSMGPAYCYKIISENSVIEVQHAGSVIGITTTNNPREAFREPQRKSTASEFIEKYTQTLNKIQEITYDKSNDKRTNNSTASNLE